MSAFAIAVFQTTATVAINDDNAPQPFVQVLNVVVETDTHILSLIRYVPDLLEFDTLVYIYTLLSYARYIILIYTFNRSRPIIIASRFHFQHCQKHPKPTNDVVFDNS